MAVYMTAVRIVAMSNPPALGEPELPARNLPGYDVCHPEPSQEHPARSTLLQLALFQAFFPYILVLDPLSSPSLLTFHPYGPHFPARISHVLPTNLVMTGPLTATDSRVNSLPEIPSPGLRSRAESSIYGLSSKRGEVCAERTETRTTKFTSTHEIEEEARSETPASSELRKEP